MIIKFAISIYETIWTDTVDKILSYNTDRREFTVQKVETGEIRTHMTSLKLNDMSLESEKYSKVGQDKIKKYLYALGLRRVLIVK